MIPDDAILKAIQTYTAEHGFPPTFREIGEEVGIKSPCAVKYRLDKLRHEGRLTFDRYKPRTIRVVEQ